MESRKFSNGKALNIGEQVYKMKKLFPDFNCNYGKGRAEWIGFIHPSELCETYKVKVSYHLGKVPKVFVIEPSLKKRDDNSPIPHTYEEDRPCIFMPRIGDWTEQKFIADTIIPWASLWLYYYEIWFATGVWVGGGEHPNKSTIMKAKKD